MIFYDHECNKPTSAVQCHEDKDITVIFFAVVKNKDKQGKLSLFHCKL